MKEMLEEEAKKKIMEDIQSGSAPAGLSDVWNYYRKIEEGKIPGDAPVEILKNYCATGSLFLPPLPQFPTRADSPEIQMQQ